MLWGPLESSLVVSLRNICGAFSNILPQEDGPGVRFARMNMPGNSEEPQSD